MVELEGGVYLARSEATLLLGHDREAAIWRLLLKQGCCYHRPVDQLSQSFDVLPVGTLVGLPC